MKTAIFNYGPYYFKARGESNHEIYALIACDLMRAGLLTVTDELELNSLVKVVNHHPSRMSDFRSVMRRTGIFVAIDEAWGDQKYVVRFTDDGPAGEEHFYRCELAPC